MARHKKQTKNQAIKMGIYFPLTTPKSKYFCQIFSITALILHFLFLYVKTQIKSESQIYIIYNLVFEQRAN